MLNRSQTPRPHARARAIAALLCAGPLMAFAQAEPKQQIERVEVTGSSIRRVNAETASPVQVISAKQIENMGARTLLQVLDNLPAAMPGQQDFRSMFTGSDGASQANLRGLGAHGTLVLLNGRRLSFYGAPEGFQRQFVNIDSIPAAAIERMEVLTDGASAIYGSDAVAGVINVITKKSFQGLQLTASTDWSDKVSSYGEKQASLLYGFGDLERDRYSLYGSLNLYKRDRIALSDTYDKRPDHFYVNKPTFISDFRIGSGSEPGVLNPGTFFAFDPTKGNARSQEPAPGCKNTFQQAAGQRCIWNSLPNALDTGPSSERATLYLNGRAKFSDTLEGFSELAYTRIELQGRNGPAALNSGSTTSWYSRNTGTTLNTFTQPFLGPNNIYNKASPELRAKMGGVVGLNYLLQDATGHFGQRNTDNSYRWLAGLRGALGDWDFETALAVAGSDSTLYQTVNVNRKGFEKAFGPFTTDAAGRLLMADKPAYEFGVISEKNAALLREAYPTFDIASSTRLITYDAKVEGTVYKLPAGEVRTAFGLNLMRESFKTPGNTDAANGLITQQGGSWFDGKRTVGALFGEAIVPLTKNLELNAALRLDKYPNFDANLAPKLGLKFKPLPELLLRGTYSEGFRAPSLAESGNGGVYAQHGGLRDKARCDETNAIANLLLKSVSATDKELGKQLLNSNCSTTIGGLTPPNKALKPEKAKIATLGLVLQPTKDLDVSLDYWFVYRRDEIQRGDFNKLYEALAAQYGAALVNAPGATRVPISDADRGNAAAAAAMCQNPANAAACAAGVPGYTMGNLAGLVNSYTNRGRTLIDGFDIDARGRVALGDYGRLNLGAAATIARRNKADYTNEGFKYEYVGYYNNPRLRATLSADWAYQNYNAGLFLNYTGSSKWATDSDDKDNAPGTCKGAYLPLPEDLCKGQPSHYTLNLSLGWSPVKDMRLGLSVKNLLDRKPYYDPHGWEGYNHRLNLFGRVYSLSASYQFK
ncbi:TonB-dependent receptor [Roseateles sp. DAIF2]|uniref:TonB-dependent receptor plug domain-containing protein n=1 Tax=Roseateles sp. DAIF2 TaxID=2714952 RepID=UPI0018BFB22D|nr:TonB-dependent receptor [Roseateles sp. DAIF2]QPF71488.1 TonB-dependent receptor [Roseateles sp. DAIF2]